jgi:hypothetical protein
VQIPDFIDNSHPKTYEVLDHYLWTEPRADFASGNFNLGGYELLHESLMEVPALRLLLSKEPGRMADGELYPAGFRADLAGTEFNEEHGARAGADRTAARGQGRGAALYRGLLPCQGLRLRQRRCRWFLELHGCRSHFELRVEQRPQAGVRGELAAGVVRGILDSVRGLQGRFDPASRRVQVRLQGVLALRGIQEEPL